MPNLHAGFLQTNTRTKICAAVFSGAFSLCLVLGSTLDKYGRLSSPISHPMIIPGFAGIFLITYLLTLMIWDVLSQRSLNKSQQAETDSITLAEKDCLSP